MDKSAIAAGFSRAAPTYDRSAKAQRRMAERLTSILPTADELRSSAAGQPEGNASIVELGCGTGLLTERLLARYPDARLHAIDLAPLMIEHCRRRWAGEPRAAFEVADAETFRPDGPAALVAANCAFQWLADAEGTLRHVRGYLAPRGRLALGTMLAGSLAELAESHAAAAGRPMPALDLWDEKRFRAALARTGLRLLPASRVETLRIDYADPLDVMRGLKEIGASLGGREGARPLSPAQMRRLAEYYRGRHTDRASGRVIATWRAFFILAERV